MRSSSNATAVADAVVNRIGREYQDALSAGKPISLLGLFNSGEFDFERYCSDFSPHPDIRELKQITIQFGAAYEILLPSAEHYITCAMFLFPAASLDKIILLSKNYAVDFYLNDTMGRETKIVGEEKKLLYEIRDRLSMLDDALDPVGAISLAEKANIEVLAEIAKNTPVPWFRDFLQSYLSHINVAHRTNEATTSGYIQSISEYIDMRCHISGMPHTVKLIEYSNDIFLDWDQLEEAGVAEPLRQINNTVSLVGALSNDLFSFEKEVIDHKTDANLVAVIMMNNFRMKLVDAIQVAASIVRDLLRDYMALLGKVSIASTQSTNLTDQDKEVLDIYLKGLKAVLQACWMWQKHTKRYKRSNSIWRETTIAEPVMA
jgi:hypothetical protein